MASEQQSGKSPDRIEARINDALVEWFLAPGHATILGVLPDSAAESVVVAFNEESCWIVDINPSLLAAETRRGPAYRLGEGWPLAAPTGRVLARRVEGKPLAELSNELSAAGFQLVEALSYAPHAGWIVPSSGDIAFALSSLETLRSNPDLVHAEPQMLVTSQQR